MQILLIRHGTTPGNLLHRYVGSTDLPLSEEGRHSLHAALFTDIPYLVTSGMLRAEQTADILFPGIKHKIVPALQEMNFGVFENRSPDEMAEDPDYRSWIASNCSGPIPEGELLSDFYARTCSALEEEIRTALASDITLLPIVAHGGTLMCVMQRYIRPETSFFDYFAKNGEGLLLEVQLTDTGKTGLSLVKQLYFSD